MRSQKDRERVIEIDTDDLAATAIAPIVMAILELVRSQSVVDGPAVAALLPEEDSQRLTEILFRDEPEEGATLEDCMDTFRRENIVRAGRQMVREIGRGTPAEEPSSESEELDRQLMQLQQLARQRDALL
jgi:hypothetical protein